MIDLSDKYFMMIEPDKKGKPTVDPIEDELTRKVDYIFSKCKPSNYCYRGFHITRCGKFSDNHDWILSNGMITNNLCTYYIRHYREFVPESEIEKINRVYDEMMIDYSDLPESLRDDMKLYIERNIEPPEECVLRYALENDFVGTLCMADGINKKEILGIAMFLFGQAPSECWGSPEAVEMWLGKKETEVT